MSDTAPAPVASLSFEEALAELDGIVRQLEGGQAPLDATIGLYDRATALKQHCEARLKDAEMRIERIVAGPDGRVGTAPFDEAG
jgi:exodeoxyribonuclease VII small subunit